MRAINRSLFGLQARFCWNSSEGISERAVFVFDPISNFQSIARGNESTISAKVKHPSSQHVVSEYASFVHKYGSYNFNTVDDYSLSIAAANTLEPNHSAASTTQTHSLMIWPDNIFLSEIERIDIAVLGKCILSQRQLSISDLNARLSQGATVKALSGIHIVMPVSSTYTVNNVLRSVEWFKAAFTSSNATQEVTYHIASEVKRPHSVPTQAFVLPHGLQYTDVHSQRRVEQIVHEILRSDGQQ